ncbi:hypothetical protein [uncultured Methylobacterium sp.]|uniref:hypothetical protein n=1 Tax=uncultured Methylobacterium sp. TaxID=157278 RepID=UPI0026268313|nr:hypothetical protein [uncultured Methylobacterium sp.]
MTQLRSLVAGLLIAAIAGPALAASCGAEIAALEPRLDEKSREVIATSSAGKEVASRREAKAEEAAENKVPPTALPSGPAPGSIEAQATAKAAESSGGTGAMEARASLNRARELEKKGDEAGCLQALGEARKQIGSP